MHFSALFATALVASATAAPTWSSGDSDDSSNGISQWLSSFFSQGSSCGVQTSNPKQPSSSLPAPTSNLKYAVLGLGVQNYTCGTNSSAAPTAIGAIADLYDITKIISSNAAQANGQAIYKAIPCAAVSANSAFGLPKVGHHYFTAAGTPTFELTSFNAILAAKKVSSANAPDDACKGRSGSKAVAWLYLADNASGVSKGVSSVYRIETAGGSSPATCAGIEGTAFSVDYATEYWFY